MKKSFDNHLIHEAKKITEALGKMFAPFCEVVLHDLRTPEHAIIAIENNLSGRKIGDSTTNMGLERIKSQDFPDVVQNYPNMLPDGRQVKSTSIGIRNNEGVCIASICLNFDTSVFSAFTTQLVEFIATSTKQLTIKEQLKAASTDEIAQIISNYAKEKNLLPGQLSSREKRDVVKLLQNKGYLRRVRHGVSIAANALQVTRPTIYNYLKNYDN